VKTGEKNAETRSPSHQRCRKCANVAQLQHNLHVSFALNTAMHICHSSITPIILCCNHVNLGIHYVIVLLLVADTRERYDYWPGFGGFTPFRFATTRTAPLVNMYDAPLQMVVVATTHLYSRCISEQAYA
jgi:hypothetical protein